MSADLLREVGKRYGLGGALTSRRLTGGYANDVFRIDGHGTAAVVHVKHPPIDARSFAWEHRLLAEVNSHMPEALPPLPALDGSTWFWHQGRPVWLVAWAPGSPADSDHRRAVAAALGRLHSCPVQMSSRPGHARLLELPLPPVREFPPAFGPWLTLIIHARTELTELIGWLEQERDRRQA